MPATRNSLLSQLSTAVLFLAALLWLVPLVWMVLIAIRPPQQPINQGNIFFGSNSVADCQHDLCTAVGTLSADNFSDVFDAVPWGKQYINTLIFVFGTLAVQLVTITLAGYAFARMRFRGKSFLFIIVLTQLMIPTAILIIPNFATIRALNLRGTLWALMLPYFGSAFGTFMLRQTFRQVPRDLEDAARIDGCSWVGILRHVYIPPSVPALVSFSLVSISAHWNEFLWPLIITNNNTRPLTIGLTQILQTSESGAAYGQIGAAVLIVIAPLIVLFLLFQRQFINSFVSSGVK
ncbi:MAG TPA: carbohydrate ABC transporter permease [Aggregatilineaceae bacterium]|nr:carbohydrate ABC transporter permease [Aggregatilineaceae bacterium]